MPSVICIGSALIDELYFCNENVIAGTSNPANLSRNIGGVLTNVAFHLAYLDVDIEYITVLGNDVEGQWVKDELNKAGIKIENIALVNDSTGKYVSFLNADGSLHAAACVDVCEKYLNPSFLEGKVETLLTGDIIITDTNISIESIKWLIDFSTIHHKTLIIEPVSVAKSRKLAALDIQNVFMITPNEDELFSICQNTKEKESDMIKTLLSRGVQNIWLRKGASGSIKYNNEKEISLAAVKIEIIDSTGAGDAALAGWIVGYVNNYNELECLQLGHTLAFEVLQIKGAVNHHIKFSSLLESRNKYYKDAK